MDSDEDTEAAGRNARDGCNVQRARARGQLLTKKAPARPPSAALTIADSETIAPALGAGWGPGQHAEPTLYDESNVWGQGPRAPRPPAAFRLHGEMVPIDFAAFVAPDVNTDDFTFYRIPGGRLAISRWTTPEELGTIASLIQARGPAAAHYVRVHDTVMPMWLNPESRQLLSETVQSPEEYGIN